jgi:hypothetical protein
MFRKIKNMFRKNKRWYKIDQHQKNKISSALVDLRDDIKSNSKQVEVFKGMYDNGTIYFEPYCVYAYVNHVIIFHDPTINKDFYISKSTADVRLSGIYLNTYTYRSHVEGIFQLDEQVNEIPINSIYGLYFIKLGYLNGLIFQKSTITSINPTVTDAEIKYANAESYSDEHNIIATQATQIAIPERGGSRKRRLRKKKSKTKKNKRI